MSKKVTHLLRSLFILLLCGSSTIISAQDVTLGTRTGASSYGVLLSTGQLNNTNKYSRQAAKYSAYEILSAGGYAGKITRLWWSKEGTGEYTFGDATIKVYMKHVPDSVHGGSSVTWSTDTAGSTLVFSATNYSIPTGTGWKEVVLTTPFLWNGTSAIEIMVDWGRPTSITSSTNDVIWARSTRTNANAFSGTSSVAGPTTISRNDNRPLVQLEIIDTNATDASLSAIVSPGSFTPEGSNDISVRVRNQGGTDLNTVDIEYELDGAAQPVFSHTFSTPLPSTVTSAPIIIGNHNLAFGYHTLKVWTKNPNGSLDPDRNDDTLSITFYAGSSLNGTYTIDPSLPAQGRNFTSFTQAIYALNQSGISGGNVYFDVAAGSNFNENNLLITATGTATDSIFFRKAGTGNNPLVTAVAGTTSRDFIFGLEGSDYIVFDGIDVLDNIANTVAAQRIEYGFAFFTKNATDGSQHNIIRNCRIEMNRSYTSSTGIYSINQNASVNTTILATNLTGSNSYNRIYNDSIVNSYLGIAITGTNDSAYYDHGNMIGVDGPNVIMNFGGASTSTKAIAVNYQDNIVIANNTINSGTGHTSGIYGIHTQTGLNSNVTIHHNKITLINSSSSGLFAIVNAMGGTGSNNVINIYNNHITGCYNAVSGSSGDYTMIQSDAGAKEVNIYNNLIENDSVNGGSSIYLIDVGPGSADPGTLVNVYDNTISGFSRALGSSTLYGIYISPLSLTGQSVSNIYRNQCNNIVHRGTGMVSAIAVGGNATHNVYRNKIYNISNESTGRASGILLPTSGSVGARCYIHNNFISNIYAPVSNNAEAVIGIGATASSGGSASTFGVYYNSIYLDASSTASTFGTSGISSHVFLTSDIRNNIVINNSNPGSAGGIVTAYRRSNTTLATYSDSSNRNMWFVSPGTRKYLYYDGTDSAVTMGAFKTKVAPRDNASINYSPFFVNTSAAPYDLHIDPNFPTPVEGTARPVKTPVAVTIDFDSTLRDTSTPDIGAHEGNFVPADLEGPTVSYTALKNTSSLANRTIVVTISDPSGVDSIGTGQPLIYYRKTMGAYFSAPATSRSGNQFTFTIDNAVMGGVNIGDVIEYYVAAQDLVAGFPNASTNPEGGAGTNPPGFFAPAAGATYTILTPLNGTYYVGTSLHTPVADYATLKDAFADYGVKGMTGAVEFILIDPAYNSSTGETLPITIPENPDASAAFTLTVKPETGMNVLIADSPSIKTSLIKLNGADYVTIDGVNANNTSLTLTNTKVIPYSLPADFRIATDSSTAVIWIASANADNGANNNTIKNTSITGYSASQSQMGIYIGSGINLSISAPSQANNNDNAIDSNFISKVRYGVVMIGNSVQTPDANNKIRNNRFGSAAPGDGFFDMAIKSDRQESALISGNDIQNVHGYEPTNGEDKYGINLLNNRNAMVSGNRVHNMKYTGNTFTTVFGINSLALGYKTNVTPSNNTIYNNAVYDLESSSTGITFNTAGIVVNDGYGDKVYYNSVHLSGQLSKGQGASAAFANGVGTLPGNSPTSGNNLEVRNNIFIMTGSQIAGTNAKLYAHYSKLANYGSNVLSNNILYVNTPVAAAGFIGGMATTNYTTFGDWQTATGTETNSLNTDPLLNTSKVLIPTNSSPALNAGTPVAGITTDLLGATRNVTTPTIGAYENAGDFRGPTIAFTPLVNTTSTSNRVLAGFATITDLSGVNVTPGTAPRIYYKKQSDLNTFNGNTSSDNGWKWAEATNTTSPFSFVIDYSLLNGGVINMNDTINYFVVAQDNAPAATVGSSAILFNPASSVALDASNFPITDTNMYRIIPGAQGNLYVGNGQTYPTLTGNGGVFEAIRNQLILTGDLTVVVTSDLTEDGTFDLSTWQEEGAGNYRISFRPDKDSVRTITGDVAVGLIRLNSAQRVVFDGADTTNNTGRYLRFVNLNTSDPVFTFINDAKTDTIRNCIVEGANTSTSDGVIAFLTSATQLTPINAGNDSNVIANNIIRNISGSNTRMGNGVYSAGSNQNRNSHNIITGNQIFNFNGSGVNISSSGNGDEWTITNNHLFDSLWIPSTGTQTAISFTPSTSPASKNNTITGNYIGGTEPMAAGGTWTNSGTGAFTGIVASFDTLGTNVVSNNVIRKIAKTNAGNSANFTGIRISRGDAVVADNIIGDTVNAADGILVNGGGVSNGIEITNTVVNSHISVQHNRIANIASYSNAISSKLRGISFSNTTNNNNSVPLNITGNAISDLLSYSMSGGITATDQAATGIFCYPNSSSGTFALVNIDGNTIYNIVAANTSDTATVAAGIVATQFAGKISANRIYHIRNRAARTQAASPAIAAGIVLLNSDQQPLIVNNMITAGYDTTDNVQYVGVWNPVTGGGATFLFNTIYVLGTMDAQQVPSYALWRGNNNNDSVNSPLNANNNIFYSVRGGSGNSFLLGNNSSVGSNTWGAQSWDHNMLYNTNPGAIGNWNGMATNFTNWQIASEKDSASSSVMVEFQSVNTGDLHLSPISYGNLFLQGIYLASVPTDFDGETRHIYPYMGADENTSFPLPVTLLNITAKRIKNNVQVDWRTASETNTSRFEVEVSGDAKNFGLTGTVKARGNSSSTSSYNFKHAQAFENTSNKGTLYYRLKMIDQNGSYKYSLVVSVSKEQSLISERDVQVYPNPFTSELAVKVSSSAKAEATAQLFDIQGRLISSNQYQVSEGENILMIHSTDEIPNGVYFLKIAFGETVLTKKVVKQ